jgi:hypothetical protein
MHISHHQKQDAACQVFFENKKSLLQLHKKRPKKVIHNA